MSSFGRLLDPLVGGVELLWPQCCPVCECWMDPGDEVFRAGSALLDRPLVHRRCIADLGVAPLAPARPASLAVGCPIRWTLADTPAFFRLLHRLKYGGEPLLMTLLARRLVELAVEAGWLVEDAVLVPMPDEPGRLRERGYGVCRLLAEGVARRTGHPIRVDLLRRRMGGRPQAKVEDPLERRRNVSGAFAVGRLSEVASTRPLILLDDQVTTGATLSAALRLLGSRGHPLLALAVAGARGAPRELGLDTRRPRAQTPTGNRPTNPLDRKDTRIATHPGQSPDLDRSTGSHEETLRARRRPQGPAGADPGGLQRAHGRRGPNHR